MIINNYHNKRYVETTDNEIIFYKWYGKRILKKEKIRAAYMQNDYVIRVLYGNNVRSYNICNVKNTEKIKLKEFIDSLNNEKLIFSIMNYGDGRVSIVWLSIMLFSGNIVRIDMNIESLIALLILIIPIVIGIITIIKYPVYNMFIYDYKNNIITIEGSFRKRQKEIKEIGEDKDILNITNDKSGQYIIKTKFNSIVLQSNIMYPINYLEPMKEVYENYHLDVAQSNIKE